MAPSLTASKALSVGPGGADIYAQSADTAQAPASTLKMVVVYTAYKWLGDGRLDDTAEVLAEDEVGGSTANLKDGDIISYRDLFYAALLPSANEAAECIARTVGDEISADEGGSSGVDGFLDKMGEEADALGWTGYVFDDPTGLSADNRLTVRQLVTLLAFEVSTWQANASGTLSRTIEVVDGPDPRTITIDHTIDPDGSVKFPEFDAGKTGTTSAAGECVIMRWVNDADGELYCSGVLDSDSGQRFEDLREVIDYTIDEAGRPTPAGNFTVRGGTLVAVDVSTVRSGELVGVTTT